MAGFCELAVSLQTPNLGGFEAKLPTVSGRHLKNSRFWQGLETGFLRGR
jgi:hypothetical protein